jgi:predicted regulator of Ras-like GTPase activity (Roadblock/LC7/MglB family)
MSQGTMDKLDGILQDMISKSNDSFDSCVVTNERGLVVAGFSLSDYSTEALAAMISLLADTAHRVNDNLKLDDPQTMIIGTFHARITTQEFVVLNNRFRIGAVMKGNGRLRYGILRRKSTVEKVLNSAAKKIRYVLETR